MVLTSSLVTANTLTEREERGEERREVREDNKLLHSFNRQLADKHLPVKQCHCYAWARLGSPLTHIEFN